MTNFSDLAAQQNNFVTLRSFWHVTNGIYIWEYVTTLDLELDMIRGRRPYRWTIWIYSLARTALLIAIILNLIGLNVTAPMNCQPFITLQLVLAYVGLVGASLLVLIRTIAIWNKNKFAVAIAVITWVTNVSFIIQAVVRLRSTWDPLMQTCVMLNIEEIKPTLLITLIADTVLLVTMLVGLVPLFVDSSPAFGLGRLLWKQGIVWLLIVVVAGVLPTVFIFLNLNVPLNLIFQLPLVIANTITATRIYRVLADYTFESTNVDAGFSKSGTKVSKIKWNNRAPISLSRIEVAVDTACEQYPTSRTAHSVGGDKPHELSVSRELECTTEIGSAK